MIVKNIAEHFGNEVAKRLAEEKLSYNHKHGLLLQLYQLKRSNPSVDIKLEVLLDRLVDDCYCPIVSAQYLDILLLQHDYKVFLYGKKRFELTV